MNFNSTYKNAYATIFVSVKILIIISSDLRMAIKTQSWGLTMNGLDSTPGVIFAPGEGVLGEFNCIPLK